MSPAPTQDLRLRVLVVDDLVDLADALAFYVRIAGHEVEVAYGGRQALEVAQRFLPDLIFLDLNMPDMDGYAVAAHLRQLGRRPLYLVAHSALTAPADVQAALAAGFDRYLCKPVDESILHTVLDELHRRNHDLDR